MPTLAPHDPAGRWLGGWLLCLTLACASTGSGEGIPDALAGVSPEFQPALVALRSAVDDRDEATAREVLTRLLARGPAGDALTMARGFERILDGRRVLADLGTSVVLRDVEGGVEALQVWVNFGEVPVELRTGPAALRLERETLDAVGHQARLVRTEVLAGFGPWSLPVGEAVSRSLGYFALEVPGDSMVLRVTWAVSQLPGQVIVAGRELPAQDLPRPRTTRTVLAPFLPTQSISVETWMICARSPHSSLAQLLERTARLEPGARAAILSALWSDASDLGPRAWERLIPALRWLVPQARQLDSPSQWRAALARRAGSLEVLETRGPRGTLDMPAHPRR